MEEIFEKYFLGSLNKKEEELLADSLKISENRKLFFDYSVERSLLIQACGRLVLFEKLKDSQQNKYVSIKNISSRRSAVRITDSSIHKNLYKYGTIALSIASLLMISIVIHRFFQVRQYSDSKAIARVIKVIGDLKVSRKKQIIQVEVNDLLREGDIITTEPNASFSFGFSDQTTITLEANTSIILIRDTSSTTGKKLFLQKGNFSSKVSKQLKELPFVIETENSNVSVVGTIFELSRTPNSTKLIVTQGQVDMQSKKDLTLVHITPGFYGIVKKDQPVEKLMVVDHWASLRKLREKIGLNTMYAFNFLSNGFVSDVSSFGDSIDLVIHDNFLVKTLFKQGVSIFVPTSTGGMNHVSTLLLSSKNSAKKLCQKVIQNQEFSFECWVKPAKQNQDFQTTLFSTSLGSIQICQKGKTFFMNIPSAFKTEEKNIIRTADIALNQKLIHLVFTYDKSGLAKIFINGQKCAEKNIGQNLANMQEDESIFIANSIHNYNPWMGEIVFISFYHRGLTEQEIAELIFLPYLTE